MYSVIGAVIHHIVHNGDTQTLFHFNSLISLTN